MPKLNEKEESESVQRNLRMTIMDPTFPVFTQNGVLISEHLYNYNIINGELLSMQINDDTKKAQTKEEIRDSNINADNSVQLNATPKKFVQTRDNNKLKRALTLPLRSLSSDSGTQQNNPGINKHSGVQLTPLLSKLSTLAMEERSSGFCSIETTPNDFKDIKSTLKRNMLFRSNSRVESSNTFPKHQRNKKLQSVVLLIYGQQDMVINLLLDEEVANSHETIEQIVGEFLIFVIISF